MGDLDTRNITDTKTKTKRLRLYKVTLENDDYTPREFVMRVLMKIFRMSEEEAYYKMMAARQQGSCVISIYTKDIAESKARDATDMGKECGHPLVFNIEPED
ncbi:MAG: ATP-dependent Clp protease adaptor ClpS [Pseudomonadota bacterium]|nr:ATP-dependent Clp protease adaptor ClpS [Pseudomonadota bacterium]